MAVSFKMKHTVSYNFCFAEFLSYSYVGSKINETSNDNDRACYFKRWDSWGKPQELDLSKVCSTQRKIEL